MLRPEVPVKGASHNLWPALRILTASPGARSIRATNEVACRSKLEAPLHGAIRRRHVPALLENKKRNAFDFALMLVVRKTQVVSLRNGHLQAERGTISRIHRIILDE